MAVLSQSVQLGLSTSPQVWRFDGVWRISYTEHIRNFIRWSSMLQVSCKFRGLSLTFSYLVQLPCLFMATALTCRSSSSGFHTSLCPMPRLSFGSVLPKPFLKVQPSSRYNLPSLGYCSKNVRMMQLIFRLPQCSSASL